MRLNDIENIIKENNNFSNEDRRRYYGLCVGDRIKYKISSGKKIEGVVAALSSTDNNAVYVKFDHKENAVKCVAEYCERID